MSDGDDFQWLYTRRVQGQPPKPPTNPPPAPSGNDIEHTQVMPVMPPAEQTAVRPATHVPDRPPVIAPLPPGAIPGSERPKVKRPVKTAIWTVLGLLALWIVAEVIAAFTVYGAAPKVDWKPPVARPADQPGTTYLLIGSDSRGNLTAEEEAKYSTGNLKHENHTDTMMLVHTGSNGTVVMSMPRDSIVSVTNAPSNQSLGTSRCFNPDAEGVCTKLNNAFQDGALGKDPDESQHVHDLDAQNLVRTIEQATGIKIDGYLEIGLGGLPKMVDAVGGITICPDAKAIYPPGKTVLDDVDSGAATADNGKPIKAVCQHANGIKALAFARDRHDFAAGDFQRAKDQREVIAGVMHKLKGWGFLLNPIRLGTTGSEVMKSGIYVGKGMSWWQMWNLYNALGDLSSGKAKSCLTPLSDGGGTWSQDRAPQMFKLIKTDQINKIGPTLCSTTGR